jgi:tRNA(Ile)-lysidine synthase
MLPALEDFLRRHPALAQARRLGVAVSGGADSVALLRLATTLAPRYGWQLSVLHVNYGLRGDESQGDENFVRLLAQELACPIEVLQTQPEATDENTLRRLRYDWFASLGLDAVLTGHTLEDQAETVLFRLLRGAGLQGMAGILPHTEEGLYRPLLGVSRQYLRDWLSLNGFVWREDSSNGILNYSRNRIRWELMPLLKTHWNPGIEGGLAQLASMAQAEEEWLSTLVPPALADLSHREGKALILDGLALAATPLALRRRLLRLAIARVKGDLSGITFPHIEAALALLEQSEGSGRIQVAGIDLMRSFDWLRVVRLEDAGNLDDRNFRLPFDPTLPLEIPASGGSLHPTLEKQCQYNEEVCNLDWTRLQDAIGPDGRLEVRNWRPGDAYLRAESGKLDKLKELFQIHRVPLWQRRSWPILVLRDHPIWARQFGPAAEWAAQQDAKEVLRLRWLADPY